MNNFPIPKREDVTPANQKIYDQLAHMIGNVPNLFAVLAHSEYALSNYLNFQKAKSSLSAKEREVINLVVSQYNQCTYCLAAHTAIAKLNGYTDAQVIEIRKAAISFDFRLDALARLVKSIMANKGCAEQAYITAFYKVGFDHGSLVDVVLAIGDKIISNYLHALTEVPVDWPAAPVLT